MDTCSVSISSRAPLFTIWAMTQAYADHAPQFALLLGRGQLQPADFAAAQKLIEDRSHNR